MVTLSGMLLVVYQICAAKRENFPEVTLCITNICQQPFPPMWGVVFTASIVLLFFST